ncbi:MAG: hypothetical protein WC150_10305 [Bacteroidia bacterium]
MQFADKFIHSFFSTYSQTTVSENDKEFICELSATNFSSTEVASIQTAYNFLEPNDQLTFTIKFGEADPKSFYSTSSNFTDFKTELDKEYLHQEGEPITATFKITKGNISNNISIYDLEIFTATLESLSVAEAYAVFNRVLSNTPFVNFKVLNLDKPFNTANIFFTQIGATTPTQTFADRHKRLDSILSASNYTNIEEHNLTPDDFQLQIENAKHSKLCLLFNHYAVVLSVVYLFDITSLKANELEFKINGYKSIKGKVDVKALPIDGTKEYFNIYNWVYCGGNLNDKIGLARNIISLHFENSGELELKGHPFQSIQSSYKVYEKQNIKQYIEIRNKISDQLLDFNNRANKVIETFASGFQKSSLALITFYFSAIAIKVLGNGDFVNVFTLDTAVLSIVFLFGSFLYYLVAKWEVKEQRKRFVDSYTNLKERYTDLLEKEDIQRILNNDKEFNADVAFIDGKLKIYSNLWKWFLAILLGGTLFLFLTYNLAQLFDTFLWKTLFEKGSNC